MAIPAPSITDTRATQPQRSDEQIDGIFEPPRGFVLAALAHSKLLIALAAVVCALLGAAYGLSRPKSYTAGATLQIGQVNPNSPGFYSYVQSASALATAFSRAISAEPVLAAVQHKLKLAPAQTVARLSASPILQSPALRVTAVGPTASAAMQLANVGADALVTYEGESNSANPQASSLLHEYRGAALHLRNVEAILGAHEHSLSHLHNAPRNALAQYEAARNAAEIRLKALGVAYTAAVSSQAPRSGLVTLLAGATSASSARKAKVEQFAFIGLLVGVLIGCLIAVVRERRRAARHFVPAFASGTGGPGTHDSRLV